MAVWLGIALAAILAPGVCARSQSCASHLLTFLVAQLQFLRAWKLSDRRLYEVFERRLLICEIILESIASGDVMLIMSDEAYFHLDGCVNKQTVDFGLQRTRERYTRDLSILLRFQFGVAFRKWESLVLTFLKKKKGLQ
jgi:hypothetical protein